MKDFISGLALFFVVVISSSSFLYSKEQSQIDSQLSLVNQAQEGNPKAQTDLALQYLAQHNHNDEIKALHYLMLAANQNYDKAQYNLALLQLSSNNYNVKNKNMAKYWLTISANNGYEPSIEALIGLNNYL